MTVLYGRFDPITGAWIKNALSTRTDQLWRAEDRNHRPSTEQRIADALADLICRPDTKSSGSGKGKGRWGGATLFIKSRLRHHSPTTRQPHPRRRHTGAPQRVEAAGLRRRNRPRHLRRQRPTPLGRKTKTPRHPRPTPRPLRPRPGCVGCGLDPDWCQAHHITYWENGGNTDIDNLALVCSRCHHQIHDNGHRIKQTPTGKHVMIPPPPETAHPTRQHPAPSKAQIHHRPETLKQKQTRETTPRPRGWHPARPERKLSISYKPNRSGYQRYPARDNPSSDSRLPSTVERGKSRKTTERWRRGRGTLGTGGMSELNFLEIVFGIATFRIREAVSVCPTCRGAASGSLVSGVG